MVWKCRKKADVNDDTKKDFEKIGVTYFMQSWQTYKKEHKNLRSSYFDAIVTEPSSALRRTRISHIHVVRIDESEVDPEEIEKFSDFCRKVLKPGD